MDIWIVYIFIFLALMNNALWKFVYKLFCRHMFSFLLDKFLGLKLLIYVVWFCLLFKKLPICFPKCLDQFAPEMYKRFRISMSSPTFCIVYFLSLVILVDAEWQLFVDLSCIS